MKKPFWIITIVLISIFAIYSYYVKAVEISVDELKQLVGDETILGGTFLQPFQGGTGTSTVQAGDVGKYLKISDDSPFSYTFDTPAGGSGVGTVSTSTSPTISNLAYWTSKDAWPETLGTVATTTLTGTAPIVFSQPIYVLGASASAVSCTVASGSVAGCLSAANWTSFNNKWDLASSTIGNAYLTNSTISGVALGSDLAALTNDATLNGSSYNGSGAISDWGLNLANANTWTGLQTFANASSTLFSATYASSTLYYGASLTNCSGKLLWADGTFSCGTDSTGSGGAGTVSTSTSPTIGNLAYWTSKDAWPELLGSAATTTLTGTSISFSNPISVIGGSASVASLNLANANIWTALQTFANASTTQLTVTGSTYLATASGNVGIGTTSPNWKLSVAGIGSFDDYVRASYFTATSTTATSTFSGGFSAGNNAALVVNQAAAANSLYINSSGNVGIGTTGPGAKLEVSGGSIAIADGTNTVSGLAVYFSGDTNTGLYRPGSDELQLVAGGNEVIGATIAGVKLNIGGDATAPGIFYNGDSNTGIYHPSADILGISTAGTARMYFNSTGNVGIGTTSPYTKLSVVGQIVGAYFTATTSTASTFPNASTTDLTVDGRVVSGWTPLTFNYSTTTVWTGTSSPDRGLGGTTVTNEYWDGAYCRTTGGTVWFNIGNGTATSTVWASSTNYYVKFSSNNTVTAGTRRYFNYGTPASSPTSASCTIKRYQSSD